MTAGAQKADQVFLPVLENSLKAQKLRTTLGVFDRSRFFFNLPSSLMESIEVVRVDVASVYVISNAPSRAGMRQHYETTRKANS